MNDNDLFYGEREPEQKTPPHTPYPDGSGYDPNQSFNQGYPNYNGSYPYPPQNPANGPAIAALVTGLISMFCCLCPYISLPCAIAAIITAVLSRKGQGMSPMAIVGLITGIIGLIIAGFLIIYVIYVMSNPALYQEIMDQYYQLLESAENSGAFLRLFFK